MFVGGISTITSIEESHVSSWKKSVESIRFLRGCKCMHKIGVFMTCAEEAIT